MECGCFLFVAFLLGLTNAYNRLRIEVTPRNQTVANGGVAIFVCKAVRGRPNPHIEWRKNSIIVASHRYTTFTIPNGIVLRIEPVRVGDHDDRFECVAENGFGELAVATPSLNVVPEESLPPGFPTFIQMPQTQTIEKGRTAVLQCQVYGEPQPKVTWLKFMVPLNKTNARYSIVNGSLTIKDAKEEDSGNYECMAENSVGSSLSHMARLQVTVRIVPPHFVIRPYRLYVVAPGGNLNVTCVAAGSPMPYVKWIKASVDITPKYTEFPGKTTLLLENIRESANYTCLAVSSMFGTVEATSEIVVRGENQNAFPSDQSFQCRCDVPYQRRYQILNCSPVFEEGCDCAVRFDCPDVPTTPQNDANQNLSPPTLPPTSECRCERRYLKHYQTKQCSPVFRAGCECPLHFDCPDVMATPEDVCQYKEKIYRIGEKIETLQLCEKCSCRRSSVGGAEMSCRSIKCRSYFKQQPLENGCYEVYEADKCCPVKVKCSDPETASQVNSSEFTCSYHAKTYHLGERIYPKEDPCITCLCDENWTGINGSGCQIVDCLLEKRLKYFRRGCIPIYHENKCCPIEFYCAEDDTGNVNNTSNLKSADECFFEGKTYSIGEVLDIKHPTNCVTCTCKTPPDFTCIHASCPRPPKYENKNCRSIYHEGVCCPTYECIQPPDS